MSDKESQNFPRPPIVAILGHVDHGKTSLLDFIKKQILPLGKPAGLLNQSALMKLSIMEKNYFYRHSGTRSIFKNENSRSKCS